MCIAVAILTGSTSRTQRKARQKLQAAGAELSAAFQKLDEAFDQLRHADRLASPGFTISYQPLNHNGGAIRTESAPGQDACFRISLPMSDPGIIGNS
jgi:hypothetical protein